MSNVPCITPLLYMPYAITQDISSVIETTWLSNYGKVCAGMDWELLPTVDDTKVHDL